ncbi:hypothetical protein MMC30_006377 [Trapelia coarctata]|nr:hypothetical protein [Trapelia coarctata]
MCYHRLYIYTTCAHSYSGPLIHSCAGLSLSPTSPRNPIPQLICSKCWHHPFHTLRFHSFCFNCSAQREQRLFALEALENGEELEGGKEDRWKWTSARKSWRGFSELRSRLKEKKLIEKEKGGITSMALATVELEVKDLDKAVIAEVEVEGASAEAMPDPEVSSFEMVLKQHENRLMSIGH